MSAIPSISRYIRLRHYFHVNNKFTYMLCNNKNLILKLFSHHFCQFCDFVSKKYSNTGGCNLGPMLKVWQVNLIQKEIFTIWAITQYWLYTSLPLVLQVIIFTVQQKQIQKIESKIMSRSSKSSSSGTRSNGAKYTPYNVREMKRSATNTEPILEPKRLQELATFGAEFQEWIERRQIRRDLLTVARETITRLLKREFKESWPFSLQWNPKSEEILYPMLRYRQCQPTKCGCDMRIFVPPWPPWLMSGTWSLFSPCVPINTTGMW